MGSDQHVKRSLQVSTRCLDGVRGSGSSPSSGRSRTCTRSSLGIQRGHGTAAPSDRAPVLRHSLTPGRWSKPGEAEGQYGSAGRVACRATQGAEVRERQVEPPVQLCNRASMPSKPAAAALVGIAKQKRPIWTRAASVEPLMTVSGQSATLSADVRRWPRGCRAGCADETVAHPESPRHRRARVPRGRSRCRTVRRASGWRLC
jgi:hypothetical protein